MSEDAFSLINIRIQKLEHSIKLKMWIDEAINVDQYVSESVAKHPTKHAAT